MEEVKNTKETNGTTDPEEQERKKPDGNYLGFDHVCLWVGNALQASSWYVSRLGFKRVAYKGLETKYRAQHKVTHVVRQGDIVIALSSSLRASKPADLCLHQVTHGDGVHDVSFEVDDCRLIHKQAVERGATSVQDPELLQDEHGSVWMGSVQTYGDVIHSFVERVDYTGPFLPGFSAVDDNDPFETFTAPVGLKYIDHCVGNQPSHEMEPVANWYEKVLQFHRFWSVDDSIMHTDYSALNSIVMADYSEKIKMPINEPAKGKKKSQIQEYVDYYGGAGVQHVALATDDIIHSIVQLKARGVAFLSIPDTYYDLLEKKLEASPINVAEDFQKLRELNILVDHDDKGYLLQIFTKPVEDRPTLFYEIIQRHGHNGFGAGNFKSLFRSIELEQEKRGNLVDFNEFSL